MANPNTTAVHADIGQAWTSIEGTTTTIIGRMITRAQNDIKDITGTTTGNTEDRAIRALADAYAIQHVMGSLGPETGKDTSLIDIRDRFYKDADQSLRKKGKSLDYYNIQFEQVNP